MKKFLALTLVAALSLTLVACTKIKEDVYEEVVEEVGEDVTEDLEHVQVSDVLVKSEDDKTVVISLQGNPTTGYSWYPLNYDDQTLKIEQEYVSSVDNSKLPPEQQVMGAGGTFNFTITGLRPGKTLVDFTYMREWEGQGSAIENHPVEVQVSEDLNVMVPVDMIK